MAFYDTYNIDGVFHSAEDEVDVHYKGLWHKVIRVWLYDLQGNIYLRVKKPSGKCDFINELHIESGESATSCFDRGMFEKLGIHERDIVKGFWVVGLLLAMACIAFGVWI